MSQKEEVPPLASPPGDKIPSLHVTIRTMAGESFELDLKATDVPSKIISQLAEIDPARFLPALQRLMYNGRRIPPNTLKTLSALGITDGGAIDLLMNEDASLNSAERTMTGRELKKAGRGAVFTRQAERAVVANAARALEHPTCCPDLVELVFKGCQLTDKDMGALARALAKRSARSQAELDQDQDEDTSSPRASSAAAVVKRGRAPVLRTDMVRRLDLLSQQDSTDGEAFGAVGMSVLIDTMRLGGSVDDPDGPSAPIGLGISYLSLSHETRIDDECAAVLGSAISSCPSLRTLAVTDSNIGLNGAYSLSADLQFSQSLTSLSLAGNKSMGALGATAILQAVQYNSVLRCLDLSRTGADDETAEALCAVLSVGCSPLDTLVLEDNAIGDAGVAAIARGLAANDAMRRLNLSRNFGLTPAGLHAFADTFVCDAATYDAAEAAVAKDARDEEPLRALQRKILKLTHVDFRGCLVGHRFDPENEAVVTRFMRMFSIMPKSGYLGVHLY